MYSIGPDSTRTEVTKLLVNFAFVIRDKFIERFGGVWPQTIEEVAPPEICALVADANDFDDIDWLEVAELALLELMIRYDARKLTVVMPEVMTAEVVFADELLAVGRSATTVPRAGRSGH